MSVAATPEPPAKVQASPIKTWLDRVIRVQARFDKLVNQNPVAYTERICTSYLADRDKDAIHKETILLSKLQKIIYHCQDKILQLCGIGDEHSTADAVRKVICNTISWVEEVFCYAIVGWDEVKRIHTERDFAYQCST